MDPEQVEEILRMMGVTRQVGQTFGREDARLMDSRLNQARRMVEDRLMDERRQDFMSILVQVPPTMISERLPSESGGHRTREFDLRDVLMSTAESAFRDDVRSQSDDMIAEIIGVPNTELSRIPGQPNDIPFSSRHVLAATMRRDRDKKNAARGESPEQRRDRNFSETEMRALAARDANDQEVLARRREQSRRVFGTIPTALFGGIRELFGVR
jgi:hypothetical protein